MTTFDLSPLLRSSVGFDAFDNIFDSVFNLNESSGAYPPYNIVKSGNNYTITVAVAGFSKSDLDLAKAAGEILDILDVPYTINILSAHRTPGYCMPT